MVKLYDEGIYLVNGTEIVPESEGAKVQALTGKAADKETAKKGTMACSILSAHNTSGDIRQVDFSFCKYSSRYDHFKEGIIENAFHPALSNAALMDIGVYCVHPLVSLFGMPASIQSSSIFLSNGFEGAGTILLQYPDMQATLRYSKISDSYLPSQIQGEAATLLIDKIQDPQQLTLLFRDGHTENPNIPAVSNNMVYEAAEFVRLIDQLQQALENDSADGIPSLIRHSWLKASCLELEIMDTVRRQQKILFPADH